MVNPLRPFNRPVFPQGGVVRPQPGGVLHPHVQTSINLLEAQLNKLNVDHPGFVKPEHVRREIERLHAALMVLNPVRQGPTLGKDSVFVPGQNERQPSAESLQLMSELVATSQHAVTAETTFQGRNIVGADGVAKQAAAFATPSISGGDRAVETAIYSVFRDAALKVGDSLSVGFYPDGRPNPLGKAQLDAALVTAKQTAANAAMPNLLAVLDRAQGRHPRTEPEYAKMFQDVLARTRFDDVVVLTEKQLNVTSDKTAEALKQKLGIIVPEEDARHAEIPNIPIRRPGEYALSDEELQIVTLKNRFEHMVGQVGAIHQAAWGDGVQKDLTFIDPVARNGAFAPYDVQKGRTYTAYLVNDPGGHAFGRTAFEIYKDTWPKL